MSQTRVVPIRIKEENVEYIDEKSAELGISRGKVVEKMMEAYRNMPSEAKDNTAETGLEEICFLYDIKEESLIKNIRFLLDSGKLYVVNGKMKWKPMAMTEEYFSLDDKIDSMGISDIEKDRLKRRIAENLNSISGTDDIGNGAGV